MKVYYECLVDGVSPYFSLEGTDYPFPLGVAEDEFAQEGQHDFVEVGFVLEDVDFVFENAHFIDVDLNGAWRTSPPSFIRKGLVVYE